MKMTFIIEGRMTAGGAGRGRLWWRYSDPDGKLIIFENYKDAVKKCDEMNSKKADRNLVFSVERRVTD